MSECRCDETYYLGECPVHPDARKVRLAPLRPARHRPTTAEGDRVTKADGLRKAPRISLVEKILVRRLGVISGPDMYEQIRMTEETLRALVDTLGISWEMVERLGHIEDPSLAEYLAPGATALAAILEGAGVERGS